ncbi:MAG: MucR family transcriptional regulator [Desulfovibrio sp.]|nr:MucR family transcriptional regulator [Desulfovibrio sp.]
MDEYLQAALGLVQAQAGVRVMTEDEISAFVARVASGLNEMDNRVEEPVRQVSALEARRSIREKSVVCLECGKSFRIITQRHLAKHDLTKEEYKVKYGLPKNTVLACKALQRGRQQRMETIQLWEKRRRDE